MRVDKSEAVKTYSTGPKLEPWIILALIGSIEDIIPLFLVWCCLQERLWAIQLWRKSGKVKFASQCIDAKSAFLGRYVTGAWFIPTWSSQSLEISAVVISAVQSLLVYNWTECYQHTAVDAAQRDSFGNTNLALQLTASCMRLMLCTRLIGAGLVTW